MSEISVFDPGGPIPEGRSVIEASAGTGKTYTIAAQVTRLVAEAGIPIEKILVVTFTRAATAELKGRIRDRLVDSLGVLRGDAPDENDKHMQVLLDVDDETLELRIQRLNEAVTRFDRAEISTLHSFSIQLLAHLGFYSRISTELEPVSADPSLWGEVAADLLVREFADDATDLVEFSQVNYIAKEVVANLGVEIIPDPSEVDGAPKVRAALAINIRAEVSRRLRKSGRAAFDEFLLEARDALTDPEIGEQARAMLASRSSVALVDESQDTDPVQWSLINAVFGDSRLVIIGDPKQSIYSFRGADIESYLASVELADTHNTLLTNWRSDGQLLSALDAMLEGTTFGDERIKYRKVEPAPQHEQARIHGAGAPLTIRRFDSGLPMSHQRGKPENPFKQDEALPAVAADAANEIVRLLTSGVEIDKELGREAVQPGDIAVLCRSKVQIKLIQAALNLRGVPAIAAKAGNVFQSQAATEWRRFLLGVERPHNLEVVKYATTGLIAGTDLAAIATLDDDSCATIQLAMREWGELLSKHGISALMADVSQGTRLTERVLARSDGERFMTDLMHITDAMNEAWRQQRLGSMLDWLEDSMRDAKVEGDNDTAENQEQRLETDSAAIQVMTIHKSKGLEFPIVLCPFSWTKEKRNREPVPMFQDLDSSGDSRRRLVDVGGKESPNFEEHQYQAQAEDLAQASRLLYVALTRARHLLIVWWIDHGYKPDNSKLQQILTQGDAGTPTDLPWLVEKAKGTIEVKTLNDMPTVMRYTPAASVTPELSVASFDRSIDDAWRRASFSSLSPDYPISARHDTYAHPLRDDESLDEAATVGGNLAMPMSGLPGGAVFGTLVHNILEHVRFDSPDLEDDVREQVSSALRYAPIKLDSEALIAGLITSIETPLGPGSSDVALRGLSSERLLDEMTFEFPVRPSGSAMDLGVLAATMRDHLGPDDPVRAYVDLLNDLPKTAFRGYLTGGIDLTAAIPGPDGRERYVVMDYKTNTLTTLGKQPAATDYSFDSMHKVMQHSHYLLQSLIYQVALHRYLQWRLPEYQPETHLGGSAYLFVRGMIGAETPVVNGTRCGVYWWNPPAAMIVDLSLRFTGGDS